MKRESPTSISGRGSIPWKGVFRIDDASLIKTIAQFKIDISQAMSPLKALHGKLLELDTQIKKCKLLRLE